MPPFFKRSKTKEKEKEKEAEAEKDREERAATPPPTYEDAQIEPPAFEDQPPSFESINGSKGAKKPHTEQDVANLTAAFSSLKLGTQRDPDVSSCLAHLKLLYAVQTLKEEIGYTDGLWEIWDNRAGPLPDSKDAGSSKKSENYVKDVLGKIREKRWAVFLARAVDRYETWWKTLSTDRLREEEMSVKSEKYSSFPDGGDDFPWTVDILPPLDVLMVWHTHMLNPRAFLEDSMRWCLKDFWTTGMPWAQVNELIDTKFNYNASDAARANWEQTTGRAWNNVDEPMAKHLECPACKETAEVPWTTCGLPELYKGDDKPGLIGKGYGDGEFSQVCTAGCNTLITQRLLSVAKMVKDTEDYLNNNYTVPSSLLDPKTGMPVQPGVTPLDTNIPNKTVNPAFTIPVPSSSKDTKVVNPLRAEMKFRENTFPNRLLGIGIADELKKLIVPGTRDPPTMEKVADLVADALADNETFARIQNREVMQYDKKDLTGGRVLTRVERFQSRKMMSRYWDNHSIFALDLVGGVMRQLTFVEKMYNIDWLHSPGSRGTIDRIIQKYQRFMLIMSESPLSLCVPTLDVDLVWHTHQLAPKAYYHFTTYNTATKGYKEARFIDHNDKVDEEKLSSSFEWTSKSYLDRFGEVYSECICWYCEAIRVNHAPNGSGLFGKTKEQKVIEAFAASPAAAACDPRNSAHISAHNAVKSNETASMRRMKYQAREIMKLRLDDAYERAAKRAAKRGKTLPPREEYYNHWGSSYHMYGPCMYPAYLTTGIYVAGDPGIMHSGSPGWAGCAQGTCGPSDISAGGCGGPGGCTSADGYWMNKYMVTPMAVCTAAYGMSMGGGAGCGGGGGGCGGGGS